MDTKSLDEYCWYSGCFSWGYIPFVRGMAIKGLKAMISEAVLKKAAVTMVEGLVKSTKNKLDDVWFAEFKKSVEDA